MNNFHELLDSRQFEDFGEALRFYRESKGVTINQLANTLAISPSYIYRLEDNTRKDPSYQVVVRMGLSLGLDLAELNTLLWLAGYAPVERVGK